MSTAEWRKSPENARNNPKLTEAEAQRIIEEAISGGQIWDVQEEINARRRAERNLECGGGLGKLSAPAKFDAAIPYSRCQAGEGAFGTYYVHQSKKYGIKLFRGDKDDVDHEFDMLGRARRVGVNCPEPLRINVLQDKDGVFAQTLIISHMDGYQQLRKAYPNSYGSTANAPLITQVKLAREFRKLHTEGLSHGDIHAGNILVNPRTKQPALVDFGYATHLADISPSHGRTGVQNMMSDLRALPKFFGLPNNGREFLDRYKGVLKNIEKQATTWDSGTYRERRGAWDRFELGIKRYHDALETELLREDRLPRSRFISGADQPRIPGLTRQILMANANTRERDIMARDRQRFPTDFRQQAARLGLNPARLEQALQPERDARKQQKPFGTPIVVLPTARKPAIKVKRNPALKTPTGAFRMKPGTPPGMRRLKPGVDEFVGLSET